MKHPTRRFLAEVNVVCHAVRTGGPAAVQPPFSAPKLVKYTAAAQAPTRRTIVSLGRLSTTADAPALHAIITGYTQLEGMYAAGAAVGQNQKVARSLGAAIRARESAVSAAARMYSVPACGVAGR